MMFPFFPLLNMKRTQYYDPYGDYVALSIESVFVEVERLPISYSSTAI